MILMKKIWKVKYNHQIKNNLYKKVLNKFQKMKNNLLLKNKNLNIIQKIQFKILKAKKK